MSGHDHYSYVAVNAENIGQSVSESVSETMETTQGAFKRWPRWVTIAAVAVSVGIAIVVTWAVTKSHYKSASASYDSSKAYQVPSAYEARLNFRLPYFSFAEPIVARVDSTKGKMKLSYWSGMDQYIFSTLSDSFSIVPVYTTMTCFNNGKSDSLQNLFPNLSKFKKLDVQTTVNGVLCDTWAYDAGTSQTTPGGSSALIPDAEGYSGSYQFFVNANDGTPVTFRAQFGHNVVVGGSHVDEYWMDYVSITPLSSVDDAEFKPPAGMPCLAGNATFGPTGAMTRSNPLHDLQMLFPEHHEARQSAFDAWAEEQGKVYASEQERAARLNVFHSNLRYIHATNRRGLTFTVAPNRFADYTASELASLKGRGVSSQSERNLASSSFRAADPNVVTPTPENLGVDPRKACGLYNVSGLPLPAEVDWRSTAQGGKQPGAGLVLPAKDQGSCGSCWTYGTTGTIEGQHAKKNGQLVSLSEQNLMDCSWYWGNQACNGGFDWMAVAWLLQANNGSIASDESYGGYLNQDGFCHYSLLDKLTTNPFTNQPVSQGARIVSCTHVNRQWESDNTQIVSDQDAVNSLNDALAQIGPISVSINATPQSFYFYKSGLYYDPACKGSIPSDLDHTVLAVGYGTDANGQKYFIVRNSWSSHWGENGYVKLSQQDNICGTATTPLFVSVA